MRSALNSSVVWEMTTEGESGKKCILQGITVCLVSTIVGIAGFPQAMENLENH